MKYRNTSRIIRSDKKGKPGYTPIDNSILQSKKLNPVQKTVLIYLISLKHDFVIRKTHIYKDMNVGRDAFNKAWDGLVELGHIVETDDTVDNLKCYHYDIYEEPVPVLLKSSDTENQSDKNTVSIISNESENTYLESNTIKSNLLDTNTGTSTGTLILGKYENEDVQKRNEILIARFDVEKELENATILKKDIFRYINESGMPNLEKRLDKDKIEEIKPLIERYHYWYSQKV